MTRPQSLDRRSAAQRPDPPIGPAQTPERRNARQRQQLVRRLEGEFAEMPCLSLTLAQSMRLFGVREDVCRRILDALVAEGILWRRADGRYTSRQPSR